MMKAMFIVMARQLLRDRGLLLLTFVLPPVIFALLSAIFSSASSGDLELKVAVAVASDAPVTIAVADGLRSYETFTVQDKRDDTEAVRLDVRSGAADAGVVFIGDVTDPETGTIQIIVEPSREIASMVLAGAIQEQLAAQIPDLELQQSAAQIEAMVGGFSPAQQSRLAAALQGAANTEDTPEGAGGAQDLIERISAMGATGPGDQDPAIAYYAGATAIMFLLFSGMQGASIMLTEKALQIPHRLFLSGYRTLAFVGGKFTFLTVQGFVQTLVIFITAALLFGVPVLSHGPLLSLAAAAMSACAAGLALLVTGLCRSKAQAQTASTFLVLVSSAIGGSMVPRFMMPGWLQSAGLLTPNAWSIETVYGILVRGQGPGELWPGFVILFGVGIIAVIITAAREKQSQTAVSITP